MGWRSPEGRAAWASRLADGVRRRSRDWCPDLDAPAAEALQAERAAMARFGSRSGRSVMSVALYHPVFARFVNMIFHWRDSDRRVDIF